MSEARWYRQSGPEGDVVLSTRVRLARNLPQYPFPWRMAEAQKQEVVQLVREAVQGENLDCLYVHTMRRRDAVALAEHHLISPEFAESGEGACVFLSKDESVSLMVNEEDHLRLQAMCAGFDLEGAYAKADALDTRLDRRLHFAFHPQLGYLTQCPTNLGTAMRASLMLHLPALEESGAIAQLSNTVSKLGMTMRGLYGEGSKPEGSIYQLSNQVTLGISEQQALENLKGVARQIIRAERTERERLVQDPQYVDRVWRALGILRTALLLSHAEFMRLISYVRVGVAMKLVPEISLDTVNALLSDAQPAAVMASAGEDLEPEARDRKRAELIRERL